MALISCRECGRQISDQAQSCPGCGCPVKIVTQSQVNMTNNQNGYTNNINNQGMPQQSPIQSNNMQINSNQVPPINGYVNTNIKPRYVMCPGCKITISDQLPYCVKCGHPIATMSEAEKKAKLKAPNGQGNKKKNNTATYIVCAVILLFLIGISSNGKKGDSKAEETVKSTNSDSVTNEESLDEKIENVSQKVNEIKVDVEGEIGNSDNSSDSNTNTAVIEDEIDYREKCQVLDYESIMRNPDEYKKVDCKLTGTIDQVIEGWFDCYTIYITDFAGNKWGCVYTYKDGESRFLEGDRVNVYGICGGTDTTTTVLGKQVTLPRIDVEIIELQ